MKLQAILFCFFKKFKAFASFRCSLIMAPTVFLLFSLEWFAPAASEFSSALRNHITAGWSDTVLSFPSRCTLGGGFFLLWVPEVLERDVLLYLLNCASAILFFLCVGEGGGSDEGRVNRILISGEFPRCFLIVGLGCWKLFWRENSCSLLPLRRRQTCLNCCRASSGTTSRFRLRINTWWCSLK